MEQILNLAWLVVALALVCEWARHRKRDRGNESQPRLIWQMLAIGLVLLLLFFAISITDDLYWTPVATEASEGTRKMLKSVTSSTPATAGVSLAAMLLAAALLLAASKVSFVDRVLRIPSLAVGFCREFSGRSPPSLS